MSFIVMDTVKRLEVHARRRGEDDRVFRIWNGQNNTYATDELTREEVTRMLLELENHAGEVLSRAQAEERVENAVEDGFESPFVATGELDDPWKTEGYTIQRGI